MEVLFEYRGSRRELAVASPSNLTDIVSEELRNLGRTGAVVLTSEDTLPTTTGRRQNAPEVYLLQRWSTLWNCYVDVRHSDEVADGDRLAVLARPKPPSKLLQMFCCASDSSLPNGNRVGNSSKHPIPKGEEIQTVNYQFRVIWDQEEEAGFLGSEEAWLKDLEQEDANIALHQENLQPGEQYVRDSSGIASWKIICKPEPREEAGESCEEESSTAEEKEVDTAAAAMVEIVEDTEVTDRLKEVTAEESKSSEESSPAADTAAKDTIGTGDENEIEGVSENEGGGERGVDKSSSPAVLEVTSEEWDGREDAGMTADD